MVYDKILELRIANAQIIVNYAQFLEENKYFEESFKVLSPLLSDDTLLIAEL
jgi:pre-mRNA-splicing factor SYF1